MHFNATFHPTAAWVIQQLREAFAYDTAPRYLIFDRDSIFSSTVVEFIKAMGTKPSRISYRSPWQYGTAERSVGSCRRELLEHVVVLSERHFIRLVRPYISHYHTERNHQGLDNELITPLPATANDAVLIMSRERVGGVLKYYYRAA